MIKGSQQTILFHVDDLKSSHKLEKVNNEFAEWMQNMYGEHKAVTINRGDTHDYLGMTLNYSEPGKFKVDMRKYVADMIECFIGDGKEIGKAKTPAGEGLFGQSEKPSEKLDKKQKELFHTIVAKGLFLAKRARPDILPTIAYLCTRVREPTTEDWNRLTRLMMYLRATMDDVLCLSADSLSVIKWYVDVSFAVHPDFKSHTGGTMTFGSGAVISDSKKQKLNTRSSTEAELVGVDDMLTKMLWTRLFLSLIHI